MRFLLVAKRDLSGYLSGLYGPVILALFVFLTGLFYNGFALGVAPKLSADVLEEFFFIGGIGTGLVAVFLAMRSVAEEKQTRTELVLATSPIAEWQVILGKWLAVVAMVGLFLVCTMHMPAMILVNGKVSLAQIGVGYAGMLLYGSAVAAIGVFASSLVRSQLLALVLSAGLVLFMVLLWMISAVTDGAFSDIAQYAAIWDKHYEPFKEGTFALTHVVYYVTVTWLFLLLATRSLERRRWQ
ncbi:MAG: ABC transporter permease [Myxococcota bacterium]